MAVYGPIFTADNVTDGLINMNSVLQLQYVDLFDQCSIDIENYAPKT